MSNIKFQIGDEVQVVNEFSPIYGGCNGVIKNIITDKLLGITIYAVKIDIEDHLVKFWDDEIEHRYSFYKLETLAAMGDYYGSYPPKKAWENSFPMSAQTIKTLFGSVILDQLLANRANKQTE
jgi:hypothetical protein